MEQDRGCFDSVSRGLISGSGAGSDHDEDHLLMGKGGELDPVGSQQFVAGLKPTVGEGGLFDKGLQGGDW